MRGTRWCTTIVSMIIDPVDHLRIPSTTMFVDDKIPFCASLNRPTVRRSCNSGMTGWEFFLYRFEVGWEGVVGGHVWVGCHYDIYIGLIKIGGGCESKGDKWMRSVGYSRRDVLYSTFGSFVVRALFYVAAIVTKCSRNTVSQGEERSDAMA